MPNKLCRQHFMRVRCPHLNMRSLTAPELATHSDAPPLMEMLLCYRTAPESIPEYSAVLIMTTTMKIRRRKLACSMRASVTPET